MLVKNKIAEQAGPAMFLTGWGMTWASASARVERRFPRIFPVGVITASAGIAMIWFADNRETI
jgi:hypothetical protein